MPEVPEVHMPQVQVPQGLSCHSSLRIEAAEF